MSNNKKSGFTLIELMFVVALIAILATIALPMLSRYHQEAADKSAQSDARIFLTYATVNSGEA